MSSRYQTNKRFVQVDPATYPLEFINGRVLIAGYAGRLTRMMVQEILSRVDYPLTEKSRLSFPLLRQIQQLGPYFINCLT